MIRQINDKLHLECSWVVEVSMLYTAASQYQLLGQVDYLFLTKYLAIKLFAVENLIYSIIPERVYVYTPLPNT